MARGAMDLPEALATFVPLAQGLDHAHAFGIFHRDLKPANVVLTVDGTPRLVDFGIAAALHAEPLTTTGQLGTLPYLPPEVFRGERGDPASIDVYAFGLLLHEALTGQRPFAVDRAMTPAAAAAAIGVRKLQAPSVELPAHFPERVRDLVARATDADPAVRPTMREMRTGLESAVERRTGATVAERYVPVAPPVPVVEDRTTRVPDPSNVPLADVPLVGSIGEAVGITGSRGVGRRRGDRNRVRLLAALAIGAVFFALGVLVFARRSGEQRVEAGSSPEPSPAVRRSAGPRRIAAPAAPERLGASPTALEGSPMDRAPSPAAAPPTPAPAAPEPKASPSVPASEPVARLDRPAASAPRAPPEEPAVERGDAAGDDEGDEAGAEPVRLDGRWELVHQVQATTYEPFLGLRLGYVVNLRQEGDRVYGQGRKVSENGAALPPGQRTPIEVAGRIEGGQLVLQFTEMGANRTSRGIIRWNLTSENGAYSGRFASDAADSRGQASAHRLP
jgi:serine/threonine-protein kinase